MKSKTVVSFDNLPAKLPLNTSLVWVTCLSYWEAPEWLIGVVGFLLVLGWIGYFISMSKQSQVDIFEDSQTETSITKPTFSSKLDKAIKGQKNNQK